MLQVFSAIAALLLAAAILLIGNGLQGTLLAVRAELEGIPAAQIGFLMASYFSGFILGCRFNPGFIRSVGHIRTFVALASIASAAALLHPFFVGFLSWAVLRGVTGFCFAGLIMIIESWLNERATNADRGRLLSVYRVVDLSATVVGNALLATADPADFHLFALTSILISIALVPVALTRATAPQPIETARLDIPKLFRVSPVAAIGAPVDKLMLDRETPAHFHPGRSARLKLGPKTVLAEFGELHPKALKGLDVKGPAVAFTVYLEAAPFPKAKSKARPALELHDLQAVARDFAFVVDAQIEAETVLRAARSAEKKLIDGAHVFDVFDGPKAAQQLGDGKKSIAISVRLQPKTKTLTDDEIEAVAQKIVASVQKAAGATLRS